MLGPDSRITPQELAGLYAIDVGTLANWRASKPRKGPRFIRVGTAIRYRWSDVKKWEARRLCK